jgi:hypothetical protein
MNHNNQLSNNGGGRSRKDSPQIAATKMYGKIDFKRLQRSVLAPLTSNYLFVRNSIMELVEEYGNADMLLKGRRHMTSIQDYETIADAFTTTQAINSRRDQLMVTVHKYQGEVDMQKTKQNSILDQCTTNKAQICEVILQKDKTLMASLFSALNDLDIKHAKAASILKIGETQLASSLTSMEAQEIKLKTNSSSAPKPQIPSTPYND